MKRFSSTFAVLLACLLAVQPAAASTTRLLSLGLDNWQLDDETNHWTNPALLRSAPDFGLFEIGTQNAAGGALTANSQWGGFHKSLGDSAVFALYVRRPYQTNDFNAAATPLTTPIIGGNITSQGVNDLPDLDAKSDVAAQWETDGPFGTGGSELGITGAPNVNRNIATPQNYADAVFAWAWGRMDWGVHYNYARNAGGQVRRVRYESSTGTDGFTELERLSQEHNMRLGWRWNGFKNSWMHMAMDASMPDFDMDYQEGRANGAYSRSYIRSEPMVNAGGLFQFGHRNETESMWSVTVRGSVIDTTAVAQRQDDDGPNGLLEVNKNAYWANTRKFASADFTWVRPFDKYRALLISSFGAQHIYTKQTFLFTDVNTPANNHADMARSTSLLFPLRVAVETSPWDFLALRAGLQKNLFSEQRSTFQDGDGTTAAVYRSSDTAVSDPNGTADGVGLSFGVGVKIVDGLMWDSVVRQLFLFDGPQVVGGRANGFLAQTTLVYRWGEEDALKRVSKLKPAFNLKKLFSRRPAYEAGDGVRLPE